MSKELSPIDRAKRAAAHRAVDFVSDGMKIGLGTGSTAAFMLERLAERIRDEGIRVTGVPTSVLTEEHARKLGIPLTTLDEARRLDLTIDGADEVDPDLRLIKGGGGALLHEKIVATASDQVIIIADAAKLVATLGAFPLPVEVVPFGWETSRALIGELLTGLDVMGYEVTRRMAGDAPFLSDQKNFILDLHLKRIGNPGQLAMVLNQIPGVVENGLFIDICDVLIVGHGDGRVTVRDINSSVEEGSDADQAGIDNIFTETVD
jgi:ribose 5-phosphate isomerase A